MESRDPRHVPPAAYLHEDAPFPPDADDAGSQRTESAWFAGPAVPEERDPFATPAYPTDVEAEFSDGGTPAWQAPSPAHAEVPAQEQEQDQEQESEPLSEPVVHASPAPQEAAAAMGFPMSRQASRRSRDKASQLGLGGGGRPDAMTAARHSNLRRTPHLVRLVLITVVVNALLIAGAVWWLREPLLTEITHHLTASDSPLHAAASDDGGTEQELTSADLRFRGQFTEIFKRLDTLSTDVSAVEGALLEKQPAASPGDASFQSEILYLRDRNRLTAWADEAIATGSRAAYEKLCETLDDPRKVKLNHAAQAEILRVHAFYLSGSRIERFDIPVAQYFPDEAQLKDSQLKDDQVIFLLQGKNHPWQVRMKAANLLSPRRSLIVGDALVKAVLEDDNLDVVKEAALSFEQLTGHHPRIFDAAAIAKWWKQYRETPPPPRPKPQPATAPAPAPAAAPAKSSPPAAPAKS